MTAGGCRPQTGDRLEAVLASLVRAMVDEAVEGALGRLEALQGAQEQDLGFVSQVEAARLAGVSPGTIRAWQTAGKLRRGHNGRVHAEELRRHLASSSARAAAEPVTADLQQERAKRAAQEILSAKALRPRSSR